MVSEKFVRTAYSSHQNCFICRRKYTSGRFHRVSKRTIINLYINEKIFLKYGSRCCVQHIDNHGFIKKEYLSGIRTKLKPINSQMFFMLDYLEPKKLFLFEKFKEISMIDETECKETTGWTKDEFICFSKYITSINNNSKRTKEQLIALYRYWIRTGTNQSTLAKLFGAKTTQVQISNYLSQIRHAINQDFVPYFLGSKRNREFFLKHNNKMAMELHQLKIDDLVIVCDGTYTRFEKSSNNDFQYLSYSVQKSTTLLKPFIICCADGYIIDCYGAFEAGINDASILSYILENDDDLAKVVVNGKTVVFLDRGFRDIYKILVEKYNFNVQIPTCQQLENENEEKTKTKQLTVKQTNETRKVTKCRFIIEKQIGRIKSCAALDNVRNTEVGHIQIDYRICCAMINFTHKACCPDEKNVFKISKLLKKKFKKNSNHLEFLLGKQLDTKLITPVNLLSINDFPKIKRKKIQKKILLGTFQLRQSKSYLKDLLRNGTAYLVNERLIKTQTDSEINKDFGNSKIIGIQITSRHKRSKKREKNIMKELSFIESFRNTYKVFIQYNPSINNWRSIKGYICTCKSGLKIAGCCSHVSTVIYFLAYARYRSLEFPAEYLNNVFIKMDQKESPNKPKYVKNKRKKKNNSQESSESSEESELDDKNEKEGNDSLNSKEKVLIEEPIENTQAKVNTGSFSLEEFKRHVPKWGAKIEYKGVKNTFVSNTCTIDYFLFGFWYVSKLVPNIFIETQQIEKTDIIIEIVSNIEKNNWNKAKELWINKIMQHNAEALKNGRMFEISLYGSELSRFIDFIKEYQKFELVQICDPDCVLNKSNIISNDSDLIYFKKVNNNVELYTGYSEKCNICRKVVSNEIRFKIKPTFLFIQSADENIFVQEIPKKIRVNNYPYRLLCTTIHKPGHFVGIFDLNERFYIVDDLNKSVSYLKSFDIISNYHGNTKENSYYKKFKTTVSFYYLELLN